MGFAMPPRPAFLERALQGLAFWIGHRHSLFRGHPLVEGALVAEACNLIQANLPDSLILCPECQYKRILPPGRAPKALQGRARADLVIMSNAARARLKDGDLSDYVQFVFEVKRGTSARASIDADLRRLLDFLKTTETHARAFLIVVGESRAPPRFVGDGKSRLGSFEIPGSDGCFHVRRTVKAAASFSAKRSAHYVCLVEVFTDRPKKLPSV